MDPNAKDNSGKTVLHHAVKTGRVDIINRLKSNFGDKLNIYEKDNQDKMAIDYAEKNSVENLRNVLEMEAEEDK